MHTRNKDKTKIWLCFDVNRCVGVLGGVEPWKFEFHPIDDCSKYVTVSLFCPYYFAVHTRNKDKTKIWLCFDVNRCVGVLGCAWLCGTKTGDGLSRGGC